MRKSRKKLKENETIPSSKEAPMVRSMQTLPNVDVSRMTPSSVVMSQMTPSSVVMSQLTPSSVVMSQVTPSSVPVPVAEPKRRPTKAELDLSLRENDANVMLYIL